MDQEQQRKMKSGLRARMKRVAERTRCPECDRKQAITKVPRLTAAEPQICVCRYCKHEFIQGES